ncbi:MAG: phosphopantothenoylcysteine decarboxylase, partial [Bacteroidia bacterium]|nr:phosphopantothenoylcysteine decarboxylase [Bacteroidia bacterium]
MLNIAITAGGTSENIDGVRKLTNVSTGKLGWECLKAVLRRFRSDFYVYYILTETAYREELDEQERPFVDFLPVSDAESVYNAVDDLTKNVRISHFIHSMAISDFTFAYAAGTYELAMEISAMQAHDAVNEIAIQEVLENPMNQYNADEKIPSDDNIVIGLKRTKKVIPLIKQNNPNTFLVGFKLLKDVSEDELISVAGQLAERNECDMVFANQLANISDNGHRGLLIKNGEIMARPVGKKQIAEAIVG